MNVVYVVFPVYLVIQQLVLDFLVLKDLSVHQVAQVPLVFKVSLVRKEIKVTEVLMVFAVLVMV